MKYYIIIIKKKLERFGLYLTKSKNGFPIVFSNLVRKGSEFFLKLGSYLFLPNGFYSPTKQSFDFDITYFYPLIVTPYSDQNLMGAKCGLYVGLKNSN